MFRDEPPKKFGLEDLSAEDLDALIAELEAAPEVIAGMAEQSALAWRSGRIQRRRIVNRAYERLGVDGARSSASPSGA